MTIIIEKLSLIIQMEINMKYFFFNRDILLKILKKNTWVR
jgi:hypothetical protein